MKRWYATDNDIINQIMQRFRPIVPKPTTAHSGSPLITTTTAPSGGRRITTNKRRYVRRRRRRRRRRTGARATTTTKNKRNNKSPQTDSSLFTLQLLPPPDHLPNPRDSNSNSNNDILLPTSSSTSSVGGGGGGSGWMNNKQIRRMMMMNVEAFSLWDHRTVETWVTVERVTGSCMDGRELLGGGGGGGCTEEEMIMNLERDTCPGFISDGENKVNWVNMAYRKMVWEEEEGIGVAPPQVVVKLVAPDDNDDEELASSLSLGFECRVRVQYEIWSKYSLEKQCRQIVVPCDVWRLKELGGGLAWRLDVQAALSLGRRSIAI